MNALEAEGLNTYYGKSHILRDVGLVVAEGRVTTLLGRNGAGKTTTLRSLVGLTPPRTGHIRVFGKETTGQPPYRVARSGVGYVPEGRRIFPTTSGTARQPRPAIVGRRAGNAVDRARFAVEPAAADPG